MNKKRVIAILGCILVILCCFIVGNRFIQHEKAQNEKINQLAENISYLRAELNLMKNPVKVEYSDTAFNYLAIGNSITKHALADYWWSETGMAASSEERDYVHLVASALEKKYGGGGVKFYAYNFYIWEVQATDRVETLELIDGYLDERLNLVTIQLGENIDDTSTLRTDLEELIRYIQGKAPEAQIVMIDNFWTDQNISILKEETAKKVGVQFVDLNEIKGLTEFQCGMGTVVYDSNGGQHRVEHNGVAKHPGDKGMEYIANAVISVVP